MYTTIRLVKTPFTSHDYLVAMLRTLKLCSHSSLKVYNTALLTVVPCFKLRYPESIHFFN